MPMLTPIKTLKPVKVVDEEDGQPLSPVSQMFHKPEASNHILAIFGFKTLVDVDHFRSQLVGFAQGHRRFHSLQVGNKDRQKLKWVRTEIDIHKHVIVPEINLAEISSGEKFLEDYLHNLSKTSIDMGKPLWEFHILNGIETSSDVKSIGIGRMHHSLGDGTSLMLYYLSFAKNAMTGSSVSTAATLIPVTKKLSKDNDLKKSLKYKMKRVWTLTRNTTVDVLTTLATQSVLKDSKNPITAPSDSGRAPRRIVQRTVSLDDIKLIKEATNTKVNDVLMAIVEAGLSRYLSRKYGELNESKGLKSDRVPDIRFRTLVTFNLRMPQLTSQIGSVRKSGNKVGFILYPLKAPMRSNPVDYLHAAKAKMDRKKASLGAHFTNSFTQIFVKLFGTKLLELPKNVSLYYSNMIGPNEDITWFECPVETMAISCYGVPTGLYVNVTSYGKKLTFALSVDERVVNDPRQLCDDLEDSLDLIKKAVTAC